MIKILIHPKDPNPYQDLLYTNLPRTAAKSTYFYDGFLSNHAFTIGLPLFYLRLLLFRLQGYTIFHIHWTYAFVIPLRNKKLSQYVSFIHAIFFILSLKLFGYNLIWTVHDVLPHQRETINDLLISRLLSRLCNKKIILYPSEINKMKQFGVDSNNCVYIPHGNYIGQYRNTVSSSLARKTLGILPEEFVYLYLGIIDTYKGVPELLNAFVSIKENNLRLIIAGKCINPAIRKIISTFDKDNRILVRLERIPDEEIQLYMNACDIVVLPFKELSNSGSAILAASFKKPLIAPNAGNISEFPKDTIFYLEDKNINLKAEMSKAYANKPFLAAKGKRLYEYIEKISWKHIGERTFELYKSI